MPRSNPISLNTDVDIADALRTLLDALSSRDRSTGRQYVMALFPIHADEDIVLVTGKGDRMEDTSADTIVSWVVHALRERGVSPQDIDRALGMARTTIHVVETGDRPTVAGVVQACAPGATTPGDPISRCCP